MFRKTGYTLAAAVIALVLMGAGCSSQTKGNVNTGDTNGGVDVNVGGSGSARPY